MTSPVAAGRLRPTADFVEHELAAAMAECQVPGAALAVYSDGGLVEFAAGVLNLGTGVEATTDSLFQIGSITKVWTASLIMQLVDEGLVDLDATVRTYLPGFHVADADAAATTTVRHLLSHTSGFEGDIFTDTGWGDGCIADYVEGLASARQLFAPGEMFSYNNAAFNVLGRIVEVLRSRPFDECLRRHLVEPLGLTHVATGPHEAIRFRAAIGHLPAPSGGSPTPAPVWSLPRSTAPAGGVLALRARDLLDFARMHLAGGRAPGGRPILSETSVSAMQARQVVLPDLPAMGAAWGLGWELFDEVTPGIVGHDGATIGQAAFLRLVPERNFAVALLTNGGGADGLEQAIVGPIIRDLAGAALPSPPVPPRNAPAVDERRFLGRFACEVAVVEVTRDPDARIWVTLTPQGEIMSMVQEPERLELVPYREDALITRQPADGRHAVYVFRGDDGHGRAQYLQTSRVLLRIGDD